MLNPSNIAAGAAAKPGDDRAQRTVIHVHDALPDDRAGIYAQAALGKEDVVVDQRRQQAAADFAVQESGELAVYRRKAMLLVEKGRVHVIEQRKVQAFHQPQPGTLPAEGGFCRLGGGLGRKGIKTICLGKIKVG